MRTPESAAIHAWRSFVRAKAEAGRALHRELREHGLTGAQLAILRVLAESGSAGVKLNEISQQLCVTSGNITGLVDHLEQAGFVARLPHPEDRRITLAVLTPEGRKVFDKLHPSHTARIKHLMSALTAKEQRLLADLLSRLADRAAEMNR
jgi:MarR family 2-MHQ and catechol resistance regulon transcriptional repressor